MVTRHLTARAPERQRLTQPCPSLFTPPRGAAVTLLAVLRFYPTGRRLLGLDVSSLLER